MKNSGGPPRLRAGAGRVALFLPWALLCAPAFPARRRRLRSAPATDATHKDELSGPYQEACVIEPVTGTVIFAKNEHQPWPTASLAKMMLMDIIAQTLDDGSLKLTDRIPASRAAAIEPAW